jgi:hypothetical protein
MRKKQTASYSGELKKPIVLPCRHCGFGEWLNPDQGRAEKEAWILAAQRKKLGLLLKHFGISPTNEHVWAQLAFALAKEHVPGMQALDGPPRKRGRRPKSSHSNRDLAIAVDMVNYERKRGVADAIRQLRKREPKVWGRYSENALRNRYYEFSKGIPRKGTFQEQVRALVLGGLPDNLY